MMKIKEAVIYLLDLLEITSQDELDAWCEKRGGGRKQFYEKVKQISEEDWLALKHPDASVRFNYEKILVGYKIHNNE